MIRGQIPSFIRSGNKLPMGFVMWFVAAFMYLTTNHFPLSEPQLLDMTWVDRNVPFLPRSVWIYTSEYLYFGLAYACIRSSENLSRYFCSFLSLQAVSVLIFMLWPTTYPRELYPLPESLDSLTYSVFCRFALRTPQPAVAQAFTSVASRSRPWSFGTNAGGSFPGLPSRVLPSTSPPSRPSSTT